MKTLLKWAGGKEREWKFIKPRLPQTIKNYYEPFLGGGAVFFNIENIKGNCYLNDISVELISFYNIIKNNDRYFAKAIENINNNWLNIDKIYKKKEEKIIQKYIHFKNNELSEKESLVFIKKVAKSVAQSLIKQSKNQTILYDEFVKSLKNKFRRTKKLEKDKGSLPSKDISDIFLSSLKSGFYTYVRELYNKPDTYDISRSKLSAYFLFMRMFCYSGMFRYNKNGEFNVPYGGMGYNQNNLAKKIKYYKSPELNNKLSNSNFYNKDFETFLTKHSPSKNDFIFLDPPYDTEFSTYAKNVFDRDDHKRLAKYLISETKAKWLLVIKSTDFILNLYDNDSLILEKIDKKYNVSFMDRNVRDVTHLIIRNYS